MVIAQPSPHVSSISFVYVEFSIWSEISFVSVFCCYFVYDIANLLSSADICQKLKKKIINLVQELKTTLICQR